LRSSAGTVADTVGGAGAERGVQGEVVTVDSGSPGGRPGQSRLRILVVIKCLGFGGAERLLTDTVSTGDHEAFDYEVAYVLDAEDGMVPLIEARGTPVHSLGASSNGDLRWMARLRRLLADGQFDVVHFHLPYTASLGRLVVASIPPSARPAIVYTDHSLWNKMAIVVKALNRATIGLDQAMIVVSDAALESLPRSIRGRARVLVHGVDLSQADTLLARRQEIRDEVRREFGVVGDDVLVVSVANLRPEKGYDVLLDATEILADRHLPVKVVAVGRGELEEEMAARHARLHLGDRLLFAGQRDDVLRILAGADVFVLASRQEGLPVVLMEATSVGLPIVATAVGGVPEVLTDGVDGLVVPPGDPLALADALSRVIADPDLRTRLGTGAKQRSAMFDVARASRTIESIYREVAPVRR